MSDKPALSEFDRICADWAITHPGEKIPTGELFADWLAGQERQRNTSSSSTGALSVSFKEVGLGNTVSTEQVTLTVDTATADYQCWNSGGHHPKAGNKETVSTSLTSTGTFPVRNGQTTGVISAGPPSQGDFSCPSGQSLYLMSVTYSGIFVTGAAGDSLEATPDPISSGPIMILIA